MLRDPEKLHSAINIAQLDAFVFHFILDIHLNQMRQILVLKLVNKSTKWKDG
jgi:hypothetical protein